MITLMPPDADIWTGNRAVVVPVNIYGVAGRGLAFDARRRYPTAMNGYHYDMAERGMRFGGGVVALPFDPQQDQHRLIAAATKEHWRDPSKMKWVQRIIEDTLPMVLRTENIQEVGVPALGCGLGGIPFVDVLEMFWVYAEKYEGLQVNVYPPR